LDEEYQGVEEEHQHDTPAEGSPADEEEENKKEAEEKLKDVAAVSRNQAQHCNRNQP